MIVDPFATVPAFLAITPRDTPEQRIRVARLAAVAVQFFLNGVSGARAPWLQP